MDPAIHPNLHLVDFNNLGSHCTDFNTLLGSHNNLTDSSNFNSENIQAQRASASLATNENTCILTADQSNSAPTGSHNLTNQLGKRAPVTKRAKRGPYKKRKCNSPRGSTDNQGAGGASSTTSTTVPGISLLATPSVPGNSNSTTTPLVPAIANSTAPREENGPQLVQSEDCGTGDGLGARCDPMTTHKGTTRTKSPHVAWNRHAASLVPYRPQDAAEVTQPQGDQTVTDSVLGLGIRPGVYTHLYSLDDVQMAGRAEKGKEPAIMRAVDRVVSRQTAVNKPPCRRPH
ncbi:hypothetical protein PCASD_14869 [Puccinia coronata f. sp. avenae]|uniref:Uncharacterized protein n=1 Tax=Puccinia coronata f. sp. avenae TaxID=200324 RepID=A0A2N5TZR8_9BASI|nr:hypothetical protein PCASD_14869 [Puccinia coronata f. sp. avenae]